ncbi:CbtB domain-containing protein [Dietzia sp.]|uniref:CbtB domain-containing protein n=1 Tax=Dietzia sp. TaxID=1871616 RepID=UPI002FD95557
MTSAEHSSVGAGIERPADSGTSAAAKATSRADVKSSLILIGVFALCVIAYYFVGVDQGAVSVFGSDTHVHEFVHDARHFAGFPCH